MVKSINATVKEDDSDIYYTVTGRVKIGDGPMKINSKGQKLKEDFAIIDKEEEQLPLTLWNNMWEEISSGDVVTLSHLKLKLYKERRYLTPSPHTPRAGKGGW